VRKWREITAGKYLRAGDYELGDRFPVTIVAIRDDEGEWRDGEKFKTVLTLDHYPGGERWGDLVPNQTSLKTLQRLFGGEDPTPCIGRQVEVLIVDTMFGPGFLIQALAQRPAQAASPPPPPPRPEPPAAATRPRTPKVQRAPKGNTAPPAKAPDLNDALDDDLIKY
jgi:hypothetical protein